MNYCYQCGKKLNAGQNPNLSGNFCSVCGTSLKGGNSSASASKQEYARQEVEEEVKSGDYSIPHLDAFELDESGTVLGGRTSIKLGELTGSGGGEAIARRKGDGTDKNTILQQIRKESKIVDRSSTVGEED